MARGRRKSKEKLTNPVYYVFCEGETEKAYVSYLKQTYRIPIKIKEKVSHSEISDQYVTAYLKRNPYDKDKDKLFVMYDGDVEEVLLRLKELTKAIPLISTPCIELWFLLHLQEHKSSLSAREASALLSQSWTRYKKGYLRPEEELSLSEGLADAMKRSAALEESGNPSSTISKFIEALEQAKKNKS